MQNKATDFFLKIIIINFKKINSFQICCGRYCDSEFDTFAHPPFVHDIVELLLFSCVNIYLLKKMMCGQVMKLTWINMWITCSITYSYLASSRDVRPNWLTVHVSVSQHPTPTSWLGLPLNKFGKIFWDLMWNNPAVPSNIMVCIKCSLSLFFFKSCYKIKKASHHNNSPTIYR